MNAFSETRDHFLDGKDDAEWDPQNEAKSPPKSPEGFLVAPSPINDCAICLLSAGRWQRHAVLARLIRRKPEVCTCRSRTCTDLPE
jgi:hypothetical protein